MLIDNKSKAAFGVRLKRGEATYTVLARKEVIVCLRGLVTVQTAVNSMFWPQVILSAGTLNTAQLLMLSGVGPASHLTQLGIPVHQDLPVGENLQDHYGTGALTFTVDQPVSLVQTRYENIPSVLKYAIFGSGPLTVLGGVEVVQHECTYLAFRQPPVMPCAGPAHYLFGAVAPSAARTALVLI